MTDKLDICPQCNGPQIEIDRFGERLVGCIECNRWTWRESDSISMALPEEDLEALRAGTNEAIGVRMAPQQLRALDKWRREQTDLPSRPEAIRRLVEQALTKNRR